MILSCFGSCGRDPGKVKAKSQRTDKSDIPAGPEIGSDDAKVLPESRIEADSDVVADDPNREKNPGATELPPKNRAVPENTVTTAATLNMWITEVNDARKSSRSCGLNIWSAAAALKWNALLGAAATGHARDMATSKQMGHFGSDGTTLRARLERAGYPGGQFGENIGSGMRTFDLVLKLWLNDSELCENVMNPVFTELGLAESGGFWDLVLAAPMTKK